MPYALSRMGLSLGIIFCLIMAIITHVSNMMYLKIKDLTPKRLESVYEIAYLMFGRSSIFVICTVLFLTNYGAIILYYMIIGETVSTLTKQALLEPSGDSNVSELDIDLDAYPWWVRMATYRGFGIVCAGLLHLTIIFKR